MIILFYLPFFLKEFANIRILCEKDNSDFKYFYKINNSGLQINHHP